MSQKINLRVWLKIPDAEAATVKNTLIRRLGYGSILADVKKERLFSIVVDGGDPLEPIATTRQSGNVGVAGSVL